MKIKRKEVRFEPTEPIMYEVKYKGHEYLASIVLNPDGTYSSRFIFIKDDKGEYIGLGEYLGHDKNKLFYKLADKIWEAIRAKCLKHLPSYPWKHDINFINKT